jgi:hypothetical protein
LSSCRRQDLRNHAFTVDPVIFCHPAEGRICASHAFLLANYFLSFCRRQDLLNHAFIVDPVIFCHPAEGRICAVMHFSWLIIFCHPAEGRICAVMHLLSILPGGRMTAVLESHPGSVQSCIYCRSCYFLSSCRRQDLRNHAFTVDPAWRQDDSY